MLSQNCTKEDVNPSFLFEISDLIDLNYPIWSKGRNFERLQKVNSQSLIQLHKVYGNKWKQISNHFVGILSPDSFIKNMFYTLARKALRKINFYIDLDCKMKGKKPKIFKLNFVFKLANLAESERISDSKSNLHIVKGFYAKLLYSLLELGKVQQNTIKQIINSQFSLQDQTALKNLDTFIENLRTIQKIFIEQKLIKKGRTKKKFPKKGLIEKAYSSQAFKNTFEDSETMSFMSLSNLSDQNIINQIKVERFEGIQQIGEVDNNQQSMFPYRNELDRYFEARAYDPILFQ